MFNATAEEQRHAANQINNWTADGQYESPVGQVFPLNEAAAAHEIQEANTLQGAGTLAGKILVDAKA